VRRLFLQPAVGSVRFGRAGRVAKAALEVAGTLLHTRALRAAGHAGLLVAVVRQRRLDDSAADVVATFGAGTGSAICTTAGTPTEADRVLLALGLVIVSLDVKGLGRVKGCAHALCGVPRSKPGSGVGAHLQHTTARPGLRRGVRVEDEAAVCRQAVPTRTCSAAGARLKDFGVYLALLLITGRFVSFRLTAGRRRGGLAGRRDN
jgi:hypothetical protein